MVIDKSDSHSPRLEAIKTRLLFRLYANWAWGRAFAIRLDDLCPGAFENVPPDELRRAVEELERDSFLRTFESRVHVYVAINPHALEAVTKRLRR